MKAAILHHAAPVAPGSRPLRIEEVPIPVPGPGEVLIKVRCCAVCRTDLHVVEGELDRSRQKSPIIPGHQVIGEVIDIVPNHPSRSAPRLRLRIGARVGVPWLNKTCGACTFCTAHRENLCNAPEFTGWTRDGGYAEYITAPSDFIYPIPESFTDLEAAPLLCAGIIGYRCLRMCNIENWSGVNLGLYGFGAAGHVAIQIAIARGASVLVCTRDRERHQKLAEELGATWVGGAVDQPPAKLDAAIIFAPAGEIVPPALKALAKGGHLVCGGIHMSAIPSIDYADLYHERSITSVTNNTREDGREFLEEAARIGVKTHVQTFALEEANEALIALKHDAIKGAAVLTM